VISIAEGKAAKSSMEFISDLFVSSSVHEITRELSFKIRFFPKIGFK